MENQIFYISLSFPARNSVCKNAPQIPGFEFYTRAQRYRLLFIYLLFQLMPWFPVLGGTSAAVPAAVRAAVPGEKAGQPNLRL